MKVRIAVCVGVDGAWCAAGWAGARPDDVRQEAREGIGTGQALRWSWIDAEVPGPDFDQDVVATGTVEGP